MNKGNTVILSGLIGFIMYGLMFDWTNSFPTITLEEVKEAEQICAPVGGVDHLGKKGGLKNMISPNRLQTVCKDGTSVLLGPR